MALFPAYPNLGIDGQVHATAGNPKLDTALKKLVDEALEPLKKLDESLSEENHDTQIEGKESKISGVVHDASGNAVAKALVLPLPYGGHTVRTDFDGKFELLGPSENRRIEMLLVRDINSNQAADVQLSDFNQPLDITVTPAVTITGCVIDTRGKPIAKAVVSPEVYMGGYNAGFGHTVFKPTDINGIYEIKALLIRQDYSISAGAVDGYVANSLKVGLIEQSGRKEMEDIVLQPAKLAIGRIAPLFTVQTLDGKQLKLEDYRGKVVLLYFWATWCRPCVASTPALKEFYKELSHYKNFEMISLSQDRNENLMGEHIKKYDLVWPQVYIGLDSKLAVDYGVENRAPVYILVGPDSKIISTVERDWDKIKAVITSVLDVSKDKTPSVQAGEKD